MVRTHDTPIGRVTFTIRWATHWQREEAAERSVPKHLFVCFILISKKGRRKRGETPYEGAIREGYEESGIDVENCIYLGTCVIGFGTYFEYKFRGLGEHLFLKPKQLGEIKGVSWKFPGSYYMRKECLMNNDLGMYVRKINSIWRASLRKE